MGWFSYKDTEQIIGDDVLDLTYGYLKDVSKKYSANLGRNITLQELQTLFELSMKHLDEQVIDGLSGKTVSGVSIKTAKKKKKQVVNICDVFAAPVASGGYVFGRVIHITGNDPHAICEIFSYYSNNIYYTPEIIKSERLLMPFVELVEIFEDWEWKVIGNCPDGIEKNISCLKFVIGGENNYYLVPGDKVDQFYKENPISNEEAKKYPEIGFKTCGAYANDFAEALEKIK